MGYLYLLCVALMFSFGGTCVKLISPYYGPEFITFFRFITGVVFLLLLKLAKRQRFPKNFGNLLRENWKWILFGATAKWLAYFTENYGLTHGLSYGNIVTQPAQTIFITLSSVLLFHEKLSPRKIFCIFLCMGGVLCISLNGRPVSVFVQGGNAYLMGLFLLSGTCAGSHVLSQKMIGDRMDIIDSNLSIFTVSSLLSLIPALPGIARGELTGVTPTFSCLIAVIGFGMITGLGFYLNAIALKLVPFYIVPVIQSTMAIFAITWGILFFHESITIYVIAGTAAFIAGLIGLQLKGKVHTAPPSPHRI